MENEYTSTGIKLLHHPDVTKLIKTKHKAGPISLQVAPTSHCNLNCSFCSNAKRDKHESLSVDVVCDLLSRLSHFGLNTVEWTGGGDPTLYENINYVIAYANVLGLEQGFITNGVALYRVKDLDSLKWLRISVNCLEYVDDIVIPEISGTLGFSYVWNERTDLKILGRIQRYVDKYKPAYVRIVPNCLASSDEQRINNDKYSELVSQWGPPYFYQRKEFERPDSCWWGYLKPFAHHDGWVYPCSSVVLNSGADGRFHERFRWVRIVDIPKLYNNEMQPVASDECDHCVFKKQNDHVSYLINPTGMENFI